jgi:hypothetical protein
MAENTTPARTNTAPPPEPPRRISRASAVYWLHRGIDARQAKEPVTACPFNPDGSVTDFFLAHWWIKGWRKAGTIEASVPST